MDDLISRAAALDAIDGIRPIRSNMEQLAMKALCWAAVKTIQPVDAVPVVHGLWEPSNDYNGYCCCSACRNSYIDPDWLIGGKWQYCPACGARMDGEADG